MSQFSCRHISHIHNCRGIQHWQSWKRKEDSCGSFYSPQSDHINFHCISTFHTACPFPSCSYESNHTTLTSLLKGEWWVRKCGQGSWALKDELRPGLCVSGRYQGSQWESMVPLEGHWSPQHQGVEGHSVTNWSMHLCDLLLWGKIQHMLIL